MGRLVCEEARGGAERPCILDSSNVTLDVGRAELRLAGLHERDLVRPQTPPPVPLDEVDDPLGEEYHARRNPAAPEPLRRVGDVGRAGERRSRELRPLREVVLRCPAVRVIARVALGWRPVADGVGLFVLGAAGDRLDALAIECQREDVRDLQLRPAPSGSPVRWRTTGPNVAPVIPAPRNASTTSGRTNSASYTQCSAMNWLRFCVGSVRTRSGARCRPWTPHRRQNASYVAPW